VHTGLRAADGAPPGRAVGTVQRRVFVFVARKQARGNVQAGWLFWGQSRRRLFADFRRVMRHFLCRLYYERGKGGRSSETSAECGGRAGGGIAGWPRRWWRRGTNVRKR
jgi:hypothetical protein